MLSSAILRLLGIHIRQSILVLMLQLLHVLPLYVCYTECINIAFKTAITVFVLLYNFTLLQPQSLG